MKTLVKKTLAHGLFGMYRALDPLLHFEEVSILVYHSISDAPLDTAVTAAEFRTHLQRLHDAGYTFVSLDAVVASLDGAPLPHKAVALTFDDGYADFVSAALPILEEFQAPATLFIVGDREHATLGNDLVLLDAMAIENLRKHPLIEIGYHTKTHPDLRHLRDAALTNEMTPPYAMHYFAYPGGNYTEASIEAVRNAGFRAAFSIKPTQVSRTSHRYLLPRLVITRNALVSDVRFFASPAASWYRKVTRL